MIIEERRLPMLTNLINRLFHKLAYIMPGGYSLRPALHRLRGANIGKDVWISQYVYMDELHPEAITINDNSTIGIRTSIITHLYWGKRKKTDGFKEVVIGKDAFRTQSGIHASALIKAKRIGDTWLEDRVYSAIPAEWVGRTQQIEIGPNSGRSNVIWWLVNHAVSYNQELVHRILHEAKQREIILTDEEILKIIEDFGPLPEYPN